MAATETNGSRRIPPLAHAKAPPPALGPDEQFEMAAAIRDALLAELAPRLDAVEAALKQPAAGPHNKRLDAAEAEVKALRAELGALPARAGANLEDFEGRARVLVDRSLEKELPARVAGLVRFKLDEYVDGAKGKLAALDKAYRELEPHLSDGEGRAGILVAKALDADFSRRVGVLVKAYEESSQRRQGVHEEERKALGTAHEKALAEYATQLKALRDEAAARGESLQKSCMAQLAEQRKAHEEERKALAAEHAKALDSMRNGCEARVMDAGKLLANIMVQMKDVVAAIPPSQVYVPPDAIRVQMVPSVVNVPKDSIQVAVEQAKADVHIHPPAAEAPVVNVHAAPYRNLTKSISYDDLGRPTTISEREE